MVSAVDCWSLDSESTCVADTSCQWKDDFWGSWCEEKGCWNQWTQTSCQQASNTSSSTYINKTCNWRTSSSTGWCMKTNCWSYDGTNETACESNAENLNCNWIDTFSSSAFDNPCVGPWNKNCWSYQNQSACSEVSGCSWGRCDEVGCWDQSTQSNCESATGSNKKACTWNTQYSYCQETGCWSYTNSSGCTSNNCTWSSSGNYCTTPTCWDLSNTNSTNCQNNTLSLDCTWDSSKSQCSSNDCWSANTQDGCQSKSGCFWEVSDVSGWCEETRCWSYDNTNETDCENNSASVPNCVWESSNNYCWENFSATNTYGSIGGNEKSCYDSFGVWNETSQTCQDPADLNIDTIHNAWNPGCYIFDRNETACNVTTGCYWGTNNTCLTNLSIMPTNEINCTSLNHSNLCNTIALLDTCCSWQGSSCSTNKFSTNCYTEVEEPPEGAAFCEDYNAYIDDSLCIKISGPPWYMPCEWINATERCGPRLDRIFEDGKENLITIDNQKSCEYAGGKWITENYCEGAISVPTGRCEAKFDEERNCNKACYACEYKSDGTNWSSSADAKEACIESKLGYCEFVANSDSFNGYGNCNVKDEFITGIAGNCDADCGSCSHKGDPTASDDNNKPSYFCRNSDAGCKWIPDLDNPNDEARGRCASNSEKTCSDRCDKCDTETQCSQYGQKKGNTSLEKQCNWDSTAIVKCQPKNGADELEICWDGQDNNNDGKMDCADSMCFSDPFCGGTTGTGAACFTADTEVVCKNTLTTDSNNCTWVNESWGSWCDIPGSDCWNHDGTNETFCESKGCSWHSNFGGFCEEDWEANDFSSCFSSNITTCGGNCTWVVDNWCQESGGWCEGKTGYSGSEFQNCWQYDDNGESTCNAATDLNGEQLCQWQQDSWCSTQGSNAGWCDHKKFTCWQYSHNQTACTNSSNTDWCQWRSDEWGSWCESKTSGSTSCWSQSNNASCVTAGCNWITGLCDPPGFGGHTFGGYSGNGSFSGTGNSCWKFDGNLTGCNNQSGCSFFTENKPFCNVEKNNNCNQYNSVAAGCNTTNGCFFSNESGNAWCSSIKEQCWNNVTLTNNQTLCNANSHCNWTISNEGWEGCEPTCFASQTEGECGSGCNWVSGWCSSGTVSEFFDDMEGGAPIELGRDAEGDASPNEIDILGFGMKDMGDAFGFGIGVKDLTNASLCNGKKIGFGTNAQSGTGKNTTKFFWYFDTDGTRTGNCALSHNSSAKGFEFYATAVYKWSTTANSLSEQYTVYRCTSGNWSVVDIKASGFPQKSCSEIGGGMIAIEKNDFERFPTLYTVGTDMRVTVATANAVGNITSPTDTASSGFATPGAVDFDLDSLDFFKLSSSNVQAKSLDNANKGYVSYSADCWTASGCSDYSCYNHPYCVSNSYGVHASGFEDTRTPKVIAISKEMYPNSSLISYFTDKPANGSLLFYHNDSTCSTLNYTVNDEALSSLERRNYSLLHFAEIFNDNGVTSLNYDLKSNTKYYFKIKVCDDGNKCGISKCSSFVTESQSSCAYCDFVTKLNAPAGWNVSYDLDSDLTYEHVQGEVCGKSAGMKTNYTDGRSANIKLYKNDNSTWFEFHNVRITKTGMSSRMSSISDDTDLPTGTTTDVGGNTVGYAGMLTSTRDKVVNNLFPEQCYIKIPGTGSCTELWHCKSDLTTCVDRTSEAILNQTGSDYCIWQIPFCDFSAWAGGQPQSGSSSSSSSSSSGGGGGGGGGGVSGGGGKKATEVTVSSALKTYSMKAGDLIQFKIENENHTIKLKSTSGNKIVLQFASTPFDVSFNDGETKNIDLDKDNVFDIQVGVKKKSFSEIDLNIKLLPKPSCSDGVKNQNEEEIDCGGVCNSCEVEVAEVTPIDQESVEEEKEEIVEESNNYVLIGLVAILLLFAIIFFKNN